MEYYLRVEGVNLDNFVYDTSDLSTVRGGGLLMLKLAELVETFLSGFSYEKISVGASWGLFKLEVDDSFKPKSFLDDVNKQLSKRSVSYPDKEGNIQTFTPWQHATWVLDITNADTGFKTGRDQAHALNRWRQLQSLSLTVPKQEEYKPDIKKVVCGFDLIRPACKWLKKEETAISHHVSNRRLYGRHQKQYFYEEETELKELQFTENLTQLTGHDTHGCHKDSIGNLEGKMAVIYLDGNSFGKTQRDLCEEKKDQQDFNELVKEGQKQFLTNRLKKIKENPSWKNSLYEDRIRLETLLWGGDEIMWVVPAWQGWWLLGTFFKETETDSWQFKNKQLTHAAGLVFCHHNAPIHRIKNLAHDLAELAKEKGKKTGYVTYQILESFDHAGNDLERFRAARCPTGVVQDELIVHGVKMLDVAEKIKSLKSNPDFSKRKLYQIVHALYGNDTEKAGQLVTKAGFSGLQELTDLKKGLGDPVCWLHVLELWDYIVMEDK